MTVPPDPPGEPRPDSEAAPAAAERPLQSASTYPPAEELDALRRALTQAENAALERDVTAQAELRELRARLRAWHARRSTRVILQATQTAAVLAPPETVRGQIMGYCRSAASLGAGLAIHAARLALNPCVPAADGPRQEPDDVGTGRSCGAHRLRPFTEGAPSISVIVPVYNANRADDGYLVAALESIAAQKPPALELIVVDDGSTDESAAVVESFMAAHPALPARLVRKENGGQSSARNRGAELARGEWLAFLDQDDIWSETHLRTVAPHLTDDVDVVYTDADIIDGDGVVVQAGIHAYHGLGGHHPKTCLDDVLFEDLYVMPGVITIRRTAFERIGGFDEQLSGCEDDDLFVRALEPGRVAYVPVSTLQWRHYSHNYGQSRRMIDSRLHYWRKLLSTCAGEPDDSETARRISLRFLNAFLSECTGRLNAGQQLAAENLAAAREVVAHLGPVDRAAFALAEGAFVRRGRAAALIRAWFMSGLQPARPQPLI